jgi:hypothetical protein
VNIVLVITIISKTLWMQVYELVFQILQVALWSSDEPNCILIGGVPYEIDYDLRWSIYIENIDNKSEGKADSFTLPVIVKKNTKCGERKFWKYLK